MTKAQAEAIQKAADEKYNGDLNAAIGAQLYGEAVIIRAGGSLPSGSDMKAIRHIKSQITKALKSKK